MDKNQRHIIVWACMRVDYLYKLKSYEDSYALSQEFCEWTTALNDYNEEFKSATFNVLTFNKENRTS